MNSTFWAEPTPIDFIFVALPFILMAYFAFVLWKESRERKRKEKEEEEKMEAACRAWVENPTAENAQAISKILRGSNGREL